MEMAATVKLQVIWDSLRAGVVTVLILDFDDKGILANFADGSCCHSFGVLLVNGKSG
jgi:hypothetical protein